LAARSLHSLDIRRLFALPTMAKQKALPFGKKSARRVLREAMTLLFQRVAGIKCPCQSVWVRGNVLFFLFCLFAWQYWFKSLCL